jgi:hypothetical protein
LKIKIDKLKKAQVTPLYKENDPLLKTNYRPVSVLCIFSKIFEKILEQQLSDLYHGVSNQMPWKDLLGLRQHTDFFQGHSASPLIT